MSSLTNLLDVVTIAGGGRSHCSCPGSQLRRGLLLASEDTQLPQQHPRSNCRHARMHIEREEGPFTEGQALQGPQGVQQPTVPYKQIDAFCDVP